MTTVQETTIAQNAAIISLLQDILEAKGAQPRDVTKTLIAIASGAASAWLEQLQDDTIDT